MIPMPLIITINAVTTMNRLLQSLVGLTALALVGCKHTPIDYPVEDYDKLFPFRGVERPDGRYEDMTILSGNPETTPSTFVYPGVTLPGTPRTYRVTLTYSFSEPADLHQGGLRKQSEVRSRCVVRYVGADKLLHELGTEKTFQGASLILNDGNQHTQTLTLSSGQPLFLLVNGTAARGSTIHVSLQAVSTDGIFATPVLETRQTQNYDEGEARLPAPFCKYIILP